MSYSSTVHPQMSSFSPRMPGVSPAGKKSPVPTEAADNEFAQAMEKASVVSPPQQDASLQVALPGGTSGVANDLLRLLGSRTEGNAATSAVNGQSTAPESFFAQVMRSVSGNGETGEDGEQNTAFSSYLKTVVGKAYQ